MFDTRPSIGHRMTYDWKRSKRARRDARKNLSCRKSILFLFFKEPFNSLSPRHDHVKEHVPSPHYKNKKKQHVYDRISVLDVLACPCTRDVRHSRAVTLLLLRLWCAYNNILLRCRVHTIDMFMYLLYICLISIRCIDSDLFFLLQTAS